MEKEYIAFGRTRVKAEEAWLVILLAVGIFAGIFFSAIKNEEFALETRMLSLVSLNELANTISAMPGIFMFILGGVSSAMIFGLVGGKFNFAQKRKAAKKRSHQKRGFISSELIAISFLAILVSVIFISPVSMKFDPDDVSANAFESVAPERIAEEIIAPPAEIKIEMLYHWVAPDSGVAKITATDIRDVTSIQKNGDEIWNREMLINEDANVNLNMDLSVTISDTIDVVVSSPSADPQIDLL